MSFQDSSDLSSSIDSGKSEHGMTRIPITGRGQNGSDIFRYVSHSACHAALPPLLNANTLVGLPSDTSGIQNVPRNSIIDSSLQNDNLAQMRFGTYSVAGDFVRQPVGVLGSNAQHEFLGYDYDYPVVSAVPSQKFSVNNPVDEFEPGCIGQSFTQLSSASGQFLKSAVTMQTVQPYVPQNHQLVSGLEPCPTDLQNPVLTSAPLGLDYYSLDSCRLPQSVSCETSFPALEQSSCDSIRPSQGTSSQTEENCNPITTSLSGGMRRTTPNYPPASGLFPACEASIGAVWEFRTPSSSVGSPCYDCSSVDLRGSSEGVSDPRMVPPLASTSFSTPKIHHRETYGDFSQKRTAGTKKLNVPKILPMNDHPAGQRAVGNSMDTQRLTTHVPRRRLTVEQEQTLLKRFAVQEYLSKREMEDLAEKLNIPTSQLRTWFGNRRSKLKAAARQRAKLEAGLGHLTDADLRSLHKRT